jgi:hypothetical protein
VTTSLDMFAYLAAFVTVVLALAVGDMVQSLHRLLRPQAIVRWSFLPLFAALLVFLAILEEFFSLWRLAGVERFTYYELLTLITPPVILSLAAMTVLPDEVPAERLDLGEYYMATRRRLFLLLALWTGAVFLRLAGLFEGYSGRQGTLADAFAVFPWQTLPLLALFALLAWSRNRWVQIAGLVALVILVDSAMSTRSIEIDQSAPSSG